MSVSTNLIKFTNKIFPPVLHPFNMQNNGEKTYAQWQFEKGADTIKCYRGKYYPEDMFAGKTVLDMGCGAAGKSLYYVSLGAARVVGVDIVAHYEREAMDFAEKLGYSQRFSFVLASATELPFPDKSFDTIIMNDFMEHVSEPEAALREAIRLLRDDGLCYINFPPYYHPTGAHMSDVINMPWAHLFFSEKQLLAAYRELVRGLPDEKERIDLRITTDENGVDHLGYINKMTLKRFKGILKNLNITPAYYAEIPLRNFLKPLARFPLTREMFVKMAVCVVGKQEIKQ